MRVNILGRGEGWEDGLTADGLKWGINYFRPELDVLFEIHPVDHPYHEKLRRERENAEAAGIRIETNETCLFLKAAFLFPDEIDYFASSTDYAIAAAIFSGATEIHLYGITMDDKGDHYEKRCGTDFWCGVAIGRGVKVIVHGNSTVMTTKDGLQYGTFKPMKRSYHVRPGQVA